MNEYLPYYFKSLPFVGLFDYIQEPKPYKFCQSGKKERYRKSRISKKKEQRKSRKRNRMKQF